MELTVCVYDVHKLIHNLDIALTEAQIDQLEKLNSHIDSLGVIQFKVLCCYQVKHTGYQFVLKYYLYYFCLFRRNVHKKFGKESYYFLSFYKLSRMFWTIRVITEATADTNNKLCDWF